MSHLLPFAGFDFFHLAAAARRAISRLRSGLKLAALALPPFRANLTA